MERADLLPAGNDPVRLTAADIRRRFQGLAPGADRGAPERLRGDNDLNPGLVMAAEPRAAAVLVPLVDHPDGLTVLLTQRTTNLTSHAGQISFPGGGIEADDADAVAAALRETAEETGIAAKYIEPVGQLDRYITRTGFMITPVVAILHASFNLILQAREVADAFEVPLAFFLDSANRRLQPAEYQGTTRYFYVYPYGERYIWGATAGMLNNLAEVLADVAH